jgi:hypothetical protein
MRNMVKEDAEAKAVLVEEDVEKVVGDKKTQTKQ